MTKSALNQQNVWLKLSFLSLHWYETDNSKCRVTDSRRAVCFPLNQITTTTTVIKLSQYKHLQELR